MKHYVYIVECSDLSLYTGYSKNVDNRVYQHNFTKYGAKSLKGKLPVKLVYQEEFNTKSRALKRELYIKTLPRNKKLDLIAANKSRQI
ncbi:MAG TPA: GIY-YIG nuclease family protein [Patescibacteria group bacterium]|nr:GIY-YIG nuclease family protein [Patescibacteria group bacterium]